MPRHKADKNSISKAYLTKSVRTAGSIKYSNTSKINESAIKSGSNGKGINRRDQENLRKPQK